MPRWGRSLIALGGWLGLVACSSEAPSVPAADAGADVAPVDAASDAPATPDADAGPICTRAAQAKTAPAALYDAFVKDLITAPNKQALVDAFLTNVQAQGGTPLEDGGDRLVFLARGAGPLGPWSIAGSFTGWKTNPQPMGLLPGTDLWVLDVHVARGTAHAYKLLSGTSDAGFTEDPLAKNVVWDGIDHQGVGFFNAIAHPADLDPKVGRIERLRAHATKLNDDRDVFVWLPPAYDDGSCKKLPHLVFHDGNESLTRASFVAAIDPTYQATPSASAVLAFVALPNQNVRLDQYTFGTSTAKGDDYGDFLLADLEPTLAKSYRLCPAASATGLAGASLGGLISAYLAFQHPEHWGFVGSQSGSFFWNGDAMVARAKTDPKVGLRFYLDHGCPNDNCDSNRALNDALVAKSYDVKHVEEPNGQHDWSYWRKRLPALLQRFREGQTACE
jgi:enterochelin esterase family protein